MPTFYPSIMKYKLVCDLCNMVVWTLTLPEGWKEIKNNHYGLHVVCANCLHQLGESKHE